MQRKQVSLLLTILAIFLWSHSIIRSEFIIGEFGLADSLPPTFFVALILLTAASSILWFSKEKHSKLLFFQLLLLISALWLTPMLVSGSPPFIRDSYRYFGWTDYIIRHEHFSSVELWYHSFPGSFLLDTFVYKVMGIDRIDSLLGVYPLFIQVLYLLPLYVFLCNTLGKERVNYIWAGAFLFYMANWVGREVINPQNLSIFLLLTLLALITSPRAWEQGRQMTAHWFLVITVFGVMAVTHLLTALAALCILGFLCLVKRTRAVIIATVICAAILAAWLMTEAYTFVLQQLTSPEGAPAKAILAFDPALVIEQNITGRISGSEVHANLVKIRLLLSATFATIGLFGAGLFFAAKKGLGIGVTVLAIAAAPLALLLAPYYITYGGELIMRLYWFALAPMAFFAVKLLDNKVTALALCTLLLFMPTLHFVARYGNEAIDYSSPAEVAGLYHFHENTVEGYTTGRVPIGMMTNIENYNQIAFERLSEENGKFVWERKEEKRNHYITIGQTEKEYYSFTQGTPEAVEQVETKLDNSVNYKLIYINEDMKLFLSED